MARKTSAKPKRKRPSVKVKRRSPSSRSRGTAASLSFSKFLLPLLLIVALIGAVTFMALSGYQTATASAFFGLRSVDIRGNERTASDDIQRIVESSVQKTGVWNADLSDIRSKLEKFPFVKAAAVSRVLPSGIRVNVTERVPAAIVHLSSGDFLVDGEGTALVMATAKNNDFPFIMQGWDESKTEKAVDR